MAAEGVLMDERSTQHRGWGGSGPDNLGVLIPKPVQKEICEILNLDTNRVASIRFVISADEPIANIEVKMYLTPRELEAFGAWIAKAGRRE